jgi:3-oxoacyl-[acyl-carrier protein] reductase
MTQSPLAGKACIVTGSSSGVGAATALALASRGASVLINCVRSRDAADEVAERCKAYGGDAIVVAGDVADNTVCHALAAAALERWGRIDGLVNNAGATKFVAAHLLGGLSAEDFHEIYAVNVVAAFQMVRACEQGLRAAGGAVVNVSSVASQDGVGSSIAYAASKGALNTLTIALARALGPQVRVNAVLPGFIETPWLRRGLGERYETFKAAYRANAALDAVLSPEDVAESILFLLESPKLTGQLLRLDAGRGIGRSAPPPR